jgi:response regulator RpfG family c-di-GMP phosphodiesterase
MSESDNPLIAEIESLKREFLQMSDKMIKDIQRNDKIMARSDKRQKQEYDELQARFAEVQALQDEIEEMQKEVVFTMGSIGESRSKETGNHVKRVAEYSYLLAKYYGMDDKEAEMLKQASPMHDIGKVAIADAILNKPGRFTEDEFEIMKSHAQLSYDMLKHSQRPLLKMAATLAYEHHEKYNGKGYPRGIAGETIHIYGRITALADVFDALGSDRCYKKAWEDEKIFELFRAERGEHFDPRLIDIFFEHLDEFLAVRDRLRDEIH